MPKKWTKEDHEKLIKLRNEGKTFKEIGKIFGKSDETCRKQYKKLTDPIYKERYEQHQRIYMKEYIKKYYSRPEAKKHRKEYESSPEYKEHKKEYNKKYRSRSEVKERRNKNRILKKMHKRLDEESKNNA